MQLPKPQPPDEPKRTPGRKNRNRWCGGKEGLEHMDGKCTMLTVPPGRLPRVGEG